MDGSEAREVPDSILSLSPTSPAPLKAHARAPTLMAGWSAGSQGQVRVWAPSPFLLFHAAGDLAVAALISLAISALIATAIICLLIPQVFNLIITLVVGGFLLLFGSLGIGCLVSARRVVRPVYLTTDSEGMAVADGKGNSRHIRWDSLTLVSRCQIDRNILSQNGLLFYAPEPIELSMVGYPPARQDELLTLIVGNGCLTHDTQNDMWYSRSSFCLSTDRTVTESSGQAISHVEE